MKASFYLRGLPFVSKFWNIATALVFIGSSAMADRPIGIDVSSYQGAAQNPPTTINWTSVKAAGITFAWAKATEGTGYTDPDFVKNEVNAKAAGVLIGAYHYARYDLHSGTNGAVAEANYFWSVAKNYLRGGNAYLIPMLDIEQPTNGYSKATLSQWINAWCVTITNNAAAAGFNVKPCIYASASHAAGWFDSSVTKWSSDIAQWNYSASSAQTGAPGHSPWPSWNFWQYTDNRTVSGITGVVDGDIFNGTLAQLQSTMVITPIGPTFVLQPADRTVAEGATVSFSSGATGTGTIHYQWRLNATNISGATLSSFTITNVQAAQGGLYSVTATDNNGSSLSEDAVLSVQVPLVNEPGSIVAPSGMVNWWPADGNANDIFGTADGVPQGGFYYAPGKIGTAFHFDGSTGYITTSAGTIPVPWTISMWVNRENSPQTSALLIGDGNVGLKLEQYNATRQVGLTILGVGDYIFNPAYTVPAGTWTLLTFVGTSTGTTLYVNGAVKGSLTNSVALPRKYIGAAYITSSAKTVDFLKGSLDEIVTFNRALSGSEIAKIYSAGSAGFVRGPQILSSHITGPTQITFDLEGQTGKNYTIYSSTNLIDWIPVGSLANPLGTNSFSDNNAAGNTQKFYRISQPY